MKSPHYWFREMIVLMGKNPDDKEFIAQNKEDKRELKLFKEYVGRIQQDVIDFPPNNK